MRRLIWILFFVACFVWGAAILNSALANPWKPVNLAEAYAVYDEVGGTEIGGILVLQCRYTTDCGWRPEWDVPWEKPPVPEAG